MSTMRPQIMRRQRRRRKDVLSAAVVLIKYFNWKFKLPNAFNFMNLNHFCSPKIKHKAAI